MLAPVWLAFAFLTRIPVPLKEATPEQLGASVAWFPLVGVVLGFCQWLLYYLLGSSLDPLLVGLSLVALSAALTGALHLDGLADVFDGLGGSHGDRARMLEIMRDPRIGAHGATALALCLLGKVIATASLCSRADWMPLVAAPVCARFAAVALIRSFPYARPDGLGRSFRDHARGRDLGLAALITAFALGFAGPPVLAPTVIALCVAGAVALWVRRRAGGLTGDAYGAAIELSELALLVAATAQHGA